MQVTFDLLIFDLEHRIFINGFYEIFITDIQVSKDGSHLWSQHLMGTVPPPHSPHTVHQINANPNTLTKGKHTWQVPSPCHTLPPHFSPPTPAQRSATMA